MPENPCEALLRDGLYARQEMTDSGNFNYDFKKYIESTKFVDDFKSGKISFGFEVFDPTTLLKESLNFGASDDEIHKFQEWVKGRESIEIKSSFFKSYVSSHPDEVLAQKYVECVLGVADKKGFSTLISRDQNIVRIQIYFNKIAANDQDPIVENFDVSNCSILSISFQKGEKLNISNSVVVKIVDESKPAVFSLDTDKGPVPLMLEGEKKKKAGDFPIGTIITSFLTWKEFEKVTENNKDSAGNWESDSSGWAPCDGRKVPNSLYQKITGETNVPELRGLFLRGLNTFDAVAELGGEVARARDEIRDPDNRVRGSFQVDDFKQHGHRYFSNNWEDGRESNSGTGNDPAKKTFFERDTVWTGGNETRPKNAAVNYYIRIN